MPLRAAWAGPVVAARRARLARRQRARADRASPARGPRDAGRGGGGPGFCAERGRAIGRGRPLARSLAARRKRRSRRLHCAAWPCVTRRHHAAGTRRGGDRTAERRRSSSGSGARSRTGGMAPRTRRARDGAARAALDAAQLAGDQQTASRIATEIASLASALGDRAPAAAPARLDLRGAWSRVRSRRSLAVTASLVLVGAAIAASTTSKPAAFLLLLGAAIVLWVTAILPEFVVYLGLVIGWVFLGIASPAQAIAGFGSPSWISVFAILAIASALSASGLVYRLGLMLVRRLPPGLVGQAAACLGSGLFLTLLLPSRTARARLLLPTALAAAQSQRFKDRSPESAFLGLSAFIGAVPLLYVFLNGSSSNFLASGLMPEEARAKFDLVFWFVAAAPLGAFVGLGSLALLWLV